MVDRCLSRVLVVAVTVLGISSCTNQQAGLAAHGVSPYQACSAQEVRYCDRRRDQACECMSQNAVNEFKTLFQ